MTKQQLIDRLYVAKTMTSVVDIDLMAEYIRGLEEPKVETPKVASEKVSEALMQKIVGRIERTLQNMNDDSFIDKDSAEFSIDHSNHISLDEVGIERDDILNEITEALEDFIEEEEEEDEEGMEEVIE